MQSVFVFYQKDILIRFLKDKITYKNLYYPKNDKKSSKVLTKK